jgi:hypothetical protein
MDPATTGVTHRRWGHRRWVLAGALLLAVVAVVVVAGTIMRERRPVGIAVTDPPASDLAGLLDRADLVVVGHVVDITEGRVLSDPVDPTSAIRTQLAQLEVNEVTVGEASDRLVLEEVAALADGTPATVEGVRPSQVGDAGLYFLVRDTEEGRVALAGPQGRYLLDPDDPDRLVPPLRDDPLASRLAALGPRGLRTAVLDAADNPSQATP